MGSPTGIYDRETDEGANSRGWAPTEHIGQNNGKEIRRKRNEGKGTKEGKRSLKQPIRIEGSLKEGKKPASRRSLPKLDFVRTNVCIFLKAVERSEPTSPMNQYFATQTGNNKQTNEIHGYEI